MSPVWKAAVTGCGCPRCGSQRCLPLFWGCPGELALAASRQGLIALGGCMIDNAHCNLKCENCGHQWEDPDAPAFDWSLVTPPRRPLRGLRRLWNRLKLWWALD